MTMEGRVKWFNNAKGYGFIISDQAVDQDIFVHYSAISQDGYRSLREGDLVEFEWTDGPKGPSAASVKRMDGESLPV